MANKKKKAIPKADRLKSLSKGKSKENDFDGNDDFDFGGFPKDVDLKRNLGCGG